MQNYLRGLIDCGGLYSMPSNHAANHFALATFWYFSIRAINGRKWPWLWLWAALICYAQVYVGKHYPGDVLVGAIVGILTGLGMFRLFEYWEHRQAQRPSIRQRKTSIFEAKGQIHLIIEPNHSEWETWLQKWFLPAVDRGPPG